MGDFYKQFETPLDKAVDKAIAEVNQAFLDDPEAQRQAEENGERWRQIFEAQQVVGRHGIVLPTATATAILAVLDGGEPEHSVLTPTMLANMLRANIAEQERRAQS